jgi:nitric oxide synthase-interacting protein
MTRHSKNNTALGYFTHAEKGKLVGIYGKKTQRIGKDSLKPFDSCYLCLLTARNPVICHKGHLYCKECIIQNIINQKEKIKHQKPVKVIKEDEKEKEMLKLFLDQDQIIQQKQVKKEENAAFWIPQKQPSEEMVDKSTDLKVVCTIGNHSLSAKKLINIKFMVEEDCKKCPVCKVDLNSNAKILGNF